MDEATNLEHGQGSAVLVTRSEHICLSRGHEQSQPAIRGRRAGNYGNPGSIRVGRPAPRAKAKVIGHWIHDHAGTIVWFIVCIAYTVFFAINQYGW